MKLLCLICLIHASLQLQCDKTHVTAHVGGQFHVVCSYETNHYMYSKKYWCKGSSRHSCEIVVDSDTVPKKTQRSVIIDARRRGLYVKVTGLCFEDTGMYWVGIDKIYADIMTSVDVVITEVSNPTLWPLTPLVDRSTCWGQPVTVRCSSTKGTNIQYAWYQQTYPEGILISQSCDLQLNCATVQKDTSYYCVASNNIDHKESDAISVQVLMPARSHCVYAVHMHGQPVYDCADRLSTTTATTPVLPTICQSSNQIYSSTSNQSSPSNQTHPDWFHSRVWMEFPQWYLFVRWGFFLCPLTFLLLVLKCTKHKAMGIKKKRETYCP